MIAGLLDILTKAKSCNGLDLTIISVNSVAKTDY